MDSLEEDWDNPQPEPMPQSKKYGFLKHDNNIERDKYTNMHSSWRDGCGRKQNKQENDIKKASCFGWGNKGGMNTRNQNSRPDNSFLLMEIDTNKIGKLIGKGGCNIKKFEEQTGVRIRIGELVETKPYLKEVRLIGKQEAQQECKELIEELLTDKPIIYSTTPPEQDSIVIDWDAVNEAADKAKAEKWANVPPIKKNFYKEDPEVANMTEDEVEDFRRTYFNINVRHVLGDGDGKIPNPVKRFDQAFKHYPEIMREIEKQGFKVPSPIQCQAWPVLLSGKDLIGIAQTGTGKTLAFLLPALIHIDGQKVPRKDRKGPSVLIIAPTRELALQIESEVGKYSYKGIKSVCIYGGGNRKDQIQVVKGGVEIIIATPGRLNDLINAKYISLSAVTYIVLDEADRMLDMGFEPQIRKVLLDIRPDRQSVMTSATWPPDVEKLASRYMCNPIQVFVGTLDLAVVHSVSQTVLVVRQEEKFDYLLEFVRDLSADDKVIIFVTRKYNADQISCDLCMAGILCQCIHGDREQIDREQALDDLRTGTVKILIATDVASRGLDISDVTKVFNYDFPKNMEEYVHRAGRTGRAGKEGEVITLLTYADKPYAAKLIKILEEAEQPIPEDLVKMSASYLRYQNSLEEGASSGHKGRNFRDRRRH